MRGEGKLTDKGALLVNTGKYTDGLLKISSSLTQKLFMTTFHGEVSTDLSQEMYLTLSKTI